MTDITKKDKILESYAKGPEQVQEAIQGLTEAQLDLKLSEESWSIRQLVHHITDGDYLWKEFLLRAAGEPERSFSLEWYWCLPQDEWVKRLSYAERDVTASLGLLHANRQHTLELLRRVPDLWEKGLPVPNQQGGYEKAPVSEVVEMQAGHVMGHIEDILRIRQCHGV